VCFAVTTWQPLVQRVEDQATMSIRPATTGAAVGEAGELEFFGAGDYLGGSFCKVDPPFWNPPFPPSLEGVMTREQYASFFNGLNKVSYESYDHLLGFCPRGCGGFAGNGWTAAVKAYLVEMNRRRDIVAIHGGVTEYGSQVEWSYGQHLNQDGVRTVYNRLDLSWDPPGANASGDVLARGETFGGSPVTAQPQGRTADVTERLAKTQELFDAGLITEEEADAKRKEILQSV